MWNSTSFNEKLENRPASVGLLRWACRVTTGYLSLILLLPVHGTFASSADVSSHRWQQFEPGDHGGVEVIEDTDAIVTSPIATSPIVTSRTSVNKLPFCDGYTHHVYLDNVADRVDNSDGDLDWRNQPWHFENAAIIGSGNPGNTIFVYGHGSAVRGVDLSVFDVWPILTLDIRHNSNRLGVRHALQYSVDNSSNWHTLATYTSGDVTWRTVAYRLPTTSATTQIRIVGIEGTTENYLRVDNIRLEGLSSGEDDSASKESFLAADALFCNGNLAQRLGITPVAIGNHVWLDENANGLQDANEPGIPDITVTLHTEDGTPVRCHHSGYRDVASSDIFARS